MERQVDKNGKFTLRTSDNTVTSEPLTNGGVTLDVNGKAKVSIDASGHVTVESSGKYTIKNDTTDLMNVVNELAKAVENLTTTGSETTQSASPATKLAVSQWRASQLKGLFTDTLPPEPEPEP